MSNDTDRELLEKAAKAIGLTLKYNYLGMRDANQPWDPLNDDGDALRLADELAIDILQRFVGGRRSEALAPGGKRFEVFAKGLNGDTLAATRRAIVRAAAALSEEQQP